MDFNYKYSYSINKIFIINKRLPTTSPQPTAQLRSPAKNNCVVVGRGGQKKKGTFTRCNACRERENMVEILFNEASVLE
jgi:hypothetical protein